VELKQKLNDAEKEAKENLRLVEHWQDEHDKLKLEEIEYVFTPMRRLHLTSVPATATMRMTKTKMTKKGVNQRLSPL